MALEIPPLTEIVARWQQGAQIGAQRYRDGVARASVDWQSPTAASNAVWQQAIQEAIGRDGFVTGVNAAGNAKWRRKALEVGAPRFASGIAAAAQDYQTGFGPSREVIAGLSLPPRGPRGSAANLERVRIVADALHQRRLQQG